MEILQSLQIVTFSLDQNVTIWICMTRSRILPDLRAAGVRLGLEIIGLTRIGLKDYGLKIGGAGRPKADPCHSVTIKRLCSNQN